MVIPPLLASKIRGRRHPVPGSTTALFPGGVFSGAVRRCPDGDGLTVIVHGQIVLVRLFGIDAPEWGQPYARQAWLHLQGLVWGKSVTCHIMDRDHYGRLVCECYGLHVYPMGLIQVLYGFAWYCPKYAPLATEYRDAQRLARLYKRGLWRQPNPVPPWAFRHSKSH